MFLSEITNQILNGVYPKSEDGEAALTQLKVPLTCGAMVVYSMVSKAIKGDVAAAKLLKELCGEEKSDAAENAFSNMSDSELLALLDSHGEYTHGE